MQPHKAPSIASVVFAFALVYIVWGSTYLGIKYALDGFPTFILGGIRFALAGLLMLIWCIFRKEDVWNLRVIGKASITGLLLLLIGNGGVVFAENYLPCALVAIVVSAAPIWFVLLDKPMWKTNFSNPFTLVGLISGFLGVGVLFYGSLTDMRLQSNPQMAALGLFALIIGSLCWAGGSIFSKYKSEGSPWVNTAWQMIAASLAFTMVAVCRGELQDFSWSAPSGTAWLAMLYLVVFGSLAAFSAYVWLLGVRPAAQVSTYAYVNPVVAVLLGFVFLGEPITGSQVLGLTIVLASILMINLDKYLKRKAQKSA